MRGVLATVVYTFQVECSVIRFLILGSHRGLPWSTRLRSTDPANMGRVELARHRRDAGNARPFSLPPAARSTRCEKLAGLRGARTLRAQIAALVDVRAPLDTAGDAAILSVLRPDAGSPPAPQPLGATAARFLLAHAAQLLDGLIGEIGTRLVDLSVISDAEVGADVCALAALSDASTAGAELVASLGIASLTPAAARSTTITGEPVSAGIRLLAFCLVRGASATLVASAGISVLRDERSPRRDAVAAASVTVSAYARDASDIAATLHARVLDARGLSPFAHLSLIRAVLESPAAAPALPDLLIAGADARGGIFEGLCGHATGSPDVHRRFRAMEGVIRVIRRVPPGTLSHMQRARVLSLVHERLHEPFPGIAQQLRDVVSALLSSDAPSPSSSSDSFWLSAAVAFADADARVKGIYAPLGTLVKRVRALPLLEARPHWLRAAVGVVALESTLGKPVADCLECVWRALLEDLEGDVDALHDRAGEDVLAALVHPSNAVLRERASQHLLPAYFRSVDDRLEEVSSGMLRALQGPTFAESARIRGIIAVLSAARKLGVFLASFSDPATLSLLRSALGSSDESIRCGALNLLVTCRVSTEPVAQVEFDLLLEMLPAALVPSGILSEHSRFRHSMRTFFERLRDCVRAARCGSGGWWMRLRKETYGGFRTDEFEERRLAFLGSVDAFLRELIGRLLCAVFPGATFGRRANALEVLDLLAGTLGFEETVLKLCAPMFQPAAVTKCILTCMVDDWERPRVVALNLGTKFPHPVPGFETSERMQSFLDYALPMVCSSSKREVDAGALMCRFVFRSLCVPASFGKRSTNDSIPLPLPRALRESARSMLSEQSPVRSDYEGANLHDLDFGCSVLHWIENKMAFAEENFVEACTDGLFHGPVQILRYVVQDLSWETSTAPASRVHLMSNFSNRLLHLATECINLAISGIALEGAAHVVQKLPEILTDDVRQRVSSACFLSVKELCVLMGLMAYHIPFGGTENTDEEHTIKHGHILALNDVERIGRTIDFVLRSTRHWGVIDGAAEGMQLTCEALLRSPAEAARVLPKEWVAGIVESATRGETYVLRRSAGLPHYVLAVLRAEGSTKKSHAMPILTEVARMLLSHVQREDLHIGAKEMSPTRSKAEESVAHALNLLRFLFLDKNLSNSILRFFSDTMIVAVKAFGSTSWLIRNSAMALFSGLIRRGVGVPQERKKEAAISSFDPSVGTTALMDGCRRIKGATALQFFSRYPELNPFFLQHLREAVAEFRKEGAVDHPSLFPALYLLSSLAPSPGGEDQVAGFSKEGFSQLLEQCLYWRSDYVRRAASAGCISMIEAPGDIPGIIAASLEEKLPAEPCSVRVRGRQSVRPAGKGTSSQVSPETVRLSQNRIHGELLRVLGVIVGTWRIMGKPLQTKTIRVLADKLPSRLWLARDPAKNPCCITRACMVLLLSRAIEISVDFAAKNELAGDTNDADVLDAIALLLRMGAETARICLLPALSSEEFERNVSFLGHESFLRVSADLASIVLVESCKRGICTVSSSFSGFSSLLTHESRLVREKTAPQAARLLSLCFSEDRERTSLLSLSPSDVPALKGLWGAVRKSLYSETEEGILVHLLALSKATLSVLKYWSDVGIFDESGVVKYSIVDVAVRATEFLRGEHCIDVFEHSLSLTGLCIGVLCKLKDAEGCAGGQRMDEIVRLWTSHVEDCCDVEQCVSTRIAACRSIQHCGFILKSCCDREAEDCSVRLLLCMLKLLEDDHSDIRKMGAVIVSEQLASSIDDTRSLDVLPAMFATQQVLCDQYAANPVFLLHLENVLGFDQCLLQCAMGVDAPLRIRKRTEEVLKGLLMKDADCDEIDPSRIFSSEIPNTHVEFVCQIQLALRSCVLLREKVKVVSELRTTCTAFASDLLGKLDEMSAKLSVGIFESEEFESCFLIVARLAAVLVLMPSQQRCTDPELNELADRLLLATQRLTCIHPALSRALESTASLVLADDEAINVEVAGVLFLL